MNAKASQGSQPSQLHALEDSELVFPLMARVVWEPQDRAIKRRLRVRKDPKPVYGATAPAVPLAVHCHWEGKAFTKRHGKENLHLPRSHASLGCSAHITQGGNHELTWCSRTV